MPGATLRSRLKKLVFLVFLGVAVWLGLSFLAIRQMTSRQFVPFPEPVPPVSWGSFSPEQLTTVDGQTLGMWFLPGRSDRPPVFLLHGFGESRKQCLPQAEIAAKLGHPVLMLSFRAHGDSTGDRSDIGWTDRHDVLAAMEWLREKYPNRKIILWGQSMGAAAALFAAAEDGKQVEKLILECPYSDLRTATWNRIGLHLPWGLQHITYWGATLAGPWVLPHLDDISPLKAASRVDRALPALILAGGCDTRATPAESEAIAAALGPHTHLYIFPKADHVQLRESDQKGYRERVEEFLRKDSTVSP